MKLRTTLISLALVSLLIWAAWGAVIVGPPPTVAVVGSPTNLYFVEQRLTSNTYVTNVTVATNWNRLAVSLGSASVNGTYTIVGGSDTNSGGVATWTNDSGNGWVISQNDPVAKALYVGLHGAKTDVAFSEPALGSIAANWFDTSENTVIAAACDFFTTICVVALNTTNITTNVNPYQVIYPTNAFLLPGMSGTFQNSNIYVMRSGSDFYGRRSGIPFATLGGAMAYATNGDTIIMEPNYYPSVGFINVTSPPNVTIYGNGSHVSYNVFLNDNDTLNDLSSDATLLLSCTNATNFISVNRCRFGLSPLETDAGELKINAGTIDLVNCDFGNLITNSSLYNAFTWLQSSTGGSNGVITFTDCHFMAYQSVANVSSGAGGAHGLGIAVTNGGLGVGRVRLLGGRVEVFAQTNFAVAPYLIGNSCISITGAPTTNQTTPYNACLEIFGTALQHGSINGALPVLGLTNNLGIPVTGFYYDAAVTNWFGSPATNSILVHLGTPVTFDRKVSASNSLGVVALLATNGTPTIADLGPNGKVLGFWVSNGVPYMSVVSNNAAVTLRILGSAN